MKNKITTLTIVIISALIITGCDKPVASSNISSNSSSETSTPPSEISSQSSSSSSNSSSRRQVNPLEELDFVFDGETNGYSVEAKSKDIADDLIIPSEYEGKPVTVIEPFAFSTCRQLKTVVIPDSVVRIGWDAFSNCSFLESVTFGKNVQRIEPMAQPHP